MTLMIPTRVAQRVRAEKITKLRESVAPEVSHSKATKDTLDALWGGKDFAQEIDAPIPEGLPEPQQWRITLMPASMRLRSKGGIDLPPESIDTQNWTHCLWKVCKVGPLVYRGPAYQGFDEALLEKLRAELEPGSLWLVDPKAPRRFHYKKILFIVVNDDQLWSRVDPNHIEGLEFRGLEL